VRDFEDSQVPRRTPEWVVRRFERIDASLGRMEKSPYPVRRWMAILLVEKGLAVVPVCLVALVLLLAPWAQCPETVLAIGWLLVAAGLFDLIWLAVFHRWRRQSQVR
jgi:hypothetical protein